MKGLKISLELVSKDQLKTIPMDMNALILKLNEMMENFKDKFLEYIPNILFSIVVLVIGYLVARLVKFLVVKFLRYLHKLLMQRLSDSIQYIKVERSTNFIGTVFFWLVLVSTFVLISEILGLHIITSWMEGLLRYSPNLLAATLIVLLAVVGGRTVADIITSVGIKVGLAYSNTLGRIVQYLILITAIIIAIDQIGIEVDILIDMVNIVLTALLFGAAFAFGMGARTSVSNILATFYVRKMYKVGQEVQIDGIQGRIAKINDTSVVIDTETGQVIVPSKSFSESKSTLINKDQL